MGIAAPLRTPQGIVFLFNAQLVSALRTPEAREWAAAQGGGIVSDSSESFAALVRAEHSRWGAFIREADFRGEYIRSSA